MSHHGATLIFVLGLTVFVGCAEELEMERNYHDSGAVYMEGGMLDGARHGPWRSYYETGETWSELHFKNGLKHGASRVYYPSGVLRMEGRYDDGERVGDWHFYDLDGREVEATNPQ